MTTAVLKVCSSGSFDIFSGRVRWVSKANDPRELVNRIHWLHAVPLEAVL